ncbi:Uncharacterised protein [Serratia ficaria]|uniref:hypothetical protein n=1 Tax=Serratia ficaria TaxID=61651 RepID=UPI0021827DAD|nr:hypothetical protein [Serratia ficaria]CAI2470036.1 Uncharacterised protein [Serratia ficaria]
MEDVDAFLISWWLTSMCMLMYLAMDFSEGYISGLKKFKAGFMKHAWPVVRGFIVALVIFVAIYKLLSVFVVPV